MIEWGEQITAFAGATQPYSRDRCVHELFTDCAAAQPTAIAMVAGDREISYGELDRCSSQLANHLIRLGVRPGDAIGLLVQRDIEMVVGMLATLKAGAAYVPLDPNDPRQRIATKLLELGSPVVLTLARLRSRIVDHDGAVVALDGDWPNIESEPTTAPNVVAHPRSLAYVIYTSGSTGRPKGVQVEHESLLNLVFWHRNTYQVSKTDRATQLASIGFDACVWELWPYLTVGAQIHVVDDDTRSDVKRLWAWMAARRIDITFLPTPLAEAAMSEPFPSDLALRAVLTGGDRLRGGLRPERPFELINHYGPTENTVVATCGPVGTELLPSIGRPIANTATYILDAKLQQVRNGVPGELCLGGSSLARGYLHDPRLTAEKFVPDPFGGQAGARLYLTGDVARWNENGDIEFVGRRDHQVKIRGVRIELGEIEAVLGQHSAVRDAAVAAVENSNGGRRLVAYVACEANDGLAREFRIFLESRLPAHMAPSAFVMLESLPLTPNGKVDRRALVDPGRDRTQLENEFVAPETPLECELIDIWCRTLNIAHIGTRDSFWDLGGDSILAASVVNEIQARMGEVVHVAALFDAPTVAELASYFDEHYSDTASVHQGATTAQPTSPGSNAVTPVVNTTQLDQLKELIPSLGPLASDGHAERNPTAVFVLAPPRSGSSLFRIMLGGHPSLFAPPELELLSFDTLAERSTICTGHYAFMREGAIRALMELRSCSAEEAEKLMGDYERRNLTVQQFYRVLQDEIGERTLVDKTTVYPLDMEVMRRAESYFDGAKYLWLQRHPCGMIRSFEEARLDLTLRFRHPFSARELAELLWHLSYDNIQRFLQEIPAERQYQLHFEDLVKSPDRVMAGVSEFLGLDLHPDMVDPYRRLDGRMTDGLHQVSRPVGDPKFHTHRRIDPAVADLWKGRVDPDSLADMTRELSGSLGYELGERLTLEPIKRVRPHTTAANVDQLTDAEVEAALAAMLRAKERDDR